MLKALLILFISLVTANAESIKIACVGDSITFGAGVENRDSNNWPKKLGELLGEKYEVHNFGVNGATMRSQP